MFLIYMLLLWVGFVLELSSVLVSVKFGFGFKIICLSVILRWLSWSWFMILFNIVFLFVFGVWSVFMSSVNKVL